MSSHSGVVDFQVAMPLLSQAAVKQGRYIIGTSRLIRTHLIIKAHNVKCVFDNLGQISVRQQTK